MADPGTKQCVMCGEDCAGRPRVKDRKGRYYCKSCYDKARERAARHAEARRRDDRAKRSGASSHNDQEQDDVFSLLESSESAASARTCPGCGTALDPRAVLCIQCGFNLQTGQPLDTATADQPAAADG